MTADTSTTPTESAVEPPERTYTLTAAQLVEVIAHGRALECVSIDDADAFHLVLDGYMDAWRATGVLADAWGVTERVSNILATVHAAAAEQVRAAGQQGAVTEACS